VAGNQQLNLTRITSPEDFWEKHLWDSYIAFTHAPQFDPSQIHKVIDIGTGGGFPGLPLAIAHPTWPITLLDSTRKKITFLETLSQELKLDQVKGISDRAEALGHHPHHRQTYDLTCIRAVGKAALCAEYSLPFLKIGGLAILYRGQWQETDTEKLIPALEKCGGKLEQISFLTTPITNSHRTCLYIRKTHTTPAQYPREIGIPSQTPLAEV
jgi:16S rRNA (guanine527-N7)-methyltransferase